MAQGQVRARARARAEANSNRLTLARATLAACFRRYREEASLAYLLTKMRPTDYFKNKMTKALLPANLALDLNRVFVHKPGSVRTSTHTYAPAHTP